MYINISIASSNQSMKTRRITICNYPSSSYKQSWWRL